ncbi:hypothetical protein [Azohydromonas aeria]|uniref:hypothetical protein n=1 Tax=Azohydromonas aeria TaxID=2590212 RepID=UPI0012F7F130|nr:hypothetical protein [Azohydromonas aeria]
MTKQLEEVIGVDVTFDLEDLKPGVEYDVVFGEFDSSVQGAFRSVLAAKTQDGITLWGNGVTLAGVNVSFFVPEPGAEPQLPRSFAV